MRKTIITLIILALILIGILLVFLINLSINSLTGKAVSTLNKYSYTKAICEGNSCQDYEIVCEGKELVSMTPITGRVTFSKDWKDPRDDETKNRICG